MAEHPFLAAAAEWKTKADGDLRSAQALLDLDPPELDAATYHCQQAAEKYLKAALVATGAQPPRTHDLGVLLDLATEPFSQLGDLREACEYLTPFAVQTRYPLFAPPISVDDANRALTASTEICEAIQRSIFTAETN